MVDKNELLKLLANDFALSVNKYRNACKESELMNTYNEEEQELEWRERIKGLTTSTDYISLKREEFWQQILIAKIEVIACIGGFKLMQEFMDYLNEHSTEELNLPTAFNWHADGIAGWYH